MRAKILILQEEPSPFLALQKSLERDHKLFMTSTVEKAMAILNSERIDLIVSRVHLANGSMFVFLKRVQDDPRFRNIPFVCFCGTLSQYSLLLDPTIAQAVLITGAAKYISLQEYCAKGICNLKALKQAIEECLQQHKLDNARGPIADPLFTDVDCENLGGHHIQTPQNQRRNHHAERNAR